MPPKTIKSSLLGMLEDLGENQLKKFRSQLLDRREEPRVRRSAVENKDIIDISDVLVSTFTEPGALKVSLEILREIDCNEEAERLDSQTKACLDTGNPIFRRNPKGELVIEASQEARNHVAGRQQQAGGRRVTVKKPEEVEAEAKAPRRL
ncbi:pyrin domain-containing protein 1-like [Centroberyx affinis]|uniref:pyrin domain-containing protein 1-like n=1 Tax=Centroberyx affinis TaxID=166261 RepID=UPI003A5C30C2